MGCAAILGATDSEDWHHTLRRAGIKNTMDRSWVIFSSLIVALHRSHHLPCNRFLLLQGIETGCFKQNPRFSCRSARVLEAFGGRWWQNSAAGRALTLHPSELLERPALRPVGCVGIPSLFSLCSSKSLLAAGTGRCFQDIGWPGDVQKRKLLVTEQRTLLAAGNT